MRQPASIDLASLWSRLGPAIAGWLLPFMLILYLGLKGGGYDGIIRSEVGIAVWWIVLLGAAVGVLPVARFGRAGWIGIGLIGGFALWTAIGVSWSASAERSVAEVGRIAMYAGVLVLTLAAQGREGLRRTVSGVASGIAVIAVLALLSRLHPASFPPNTTGHFINAAKERLNYPLNYWNGLAALVAIGVPLALALASRARTVPVRALAAAAVPAMALTAYYTLSRGGVLEIAVALVALIALHPRRLALLPTLITTGCGSAILIAAATQRSALEHGLGTSTAHSQGDEMFAIVLVVCAGVALLQVAIGLAARYGLGPRISVNRSTSLVGLGVAAIAAVVIAIAAGLPNQLSNDWETFKDQAGPGSGSERFASASGNGRYQYWSAAVHENGSDPLIGTGPGTYEFWWTQHGDISGFVRNAHSLYLETLGELGIVGFAVIVALVGWILFAGCVRALTASRDRTLAAGATAGAFAFAAAAAVDWVWQIAVIPVAFLLLAGAILGQSHTSRVGSAKRVPARIALVAMAVIALIAIAIPFAGEDGVQASQADVRSGNLSSALDEAQTAQNVQPYSATASLQEALVLEKMGNLKDATSAARAATEKGSQDWRNWLVLSRLQAERGNASQSVAAYRQARALDPRSPLFSQ